MEENLDLNVDNTGDSQDMAQQSPEMGGDLTPEEAKASLGLATRLSEQHLMSMVPPEEAPTEETQPEAPQEPQNEPEEQPVQPEQTKNAEEEPKAAEKIDLEPLKADIEKTIQEAVKKEMKSLRKELEDELNAED